MTATVALIKREFLEHRAAFLYAPAAVLVVLTLAMSYGILTGNMTCNLEHGNLPSGATPGAMPSATQLYQVGVAGAFSGWATYLLIGLFFYYADSFSADRRNNTLLFWKSMPQSDLKVLTTKALAGITIFPALIAAFALLSGVLLYPLFILASLRFPLLQPPGLLAVLSALLQSAVVGSLYLLLTALWYAPFLAWVAGLSTLFQRWSIPLAILLPNVVVLLEYLRSGGSSMAGRPIARFLAWRLDNFLDGSTVFSSLLAGSGHSPMALVGVMFTRIHWLHMVLGWCLVPAVVYLASEYRRRHIEA